MGCSNSDPGPTRQVTESSTGASDASSTTGPSEKSSTREGETSRSRGSSSINSGAVSERDAALPLIDGGTTGSGLSLHDGGAVPSSSESELDASQLSTLDAATDAASVDFDAGSIAPPACAQVPCVSRTRVVYDGNRVALEFWGWGTQAEFLDVHLEGPGDEFAIAGWWNSRLGSVRFRPDGGYGYGMIRPNDDGSFTGYATMIVAERPETLTVRLLDSQGQTIIISQAQLGDGVAEAAPLGSLCDLEAMLFECSNGLACDIRDGTKETTCQVMEAECEAPAEVFSLALSGATGDLSGEFGELGEDWTLGSCTRQRGDHGADNVFRFVPETAGTYRFTFLGEATTLFVRRYCDFPSIAESELGCVSTLSSTPRPQDTESLDVSLQADVPYFVFVEGSWAGGGLYSLSVEKLP